MKPTKSLKDVLPSKQRDPEDARVGLSVEALRRSIAQHLSYAQGRDPARASQNDLYTALAYAVRERLLHRGIHAMETYAREDVKHVCYLSAEFLTGPHLGNNLINLGIYDAARQAVEAYGVNLEDLLEQEEEPGLGNGGLGRLAACYLDSLATLEVPAIGYGIRYEYGIFDQAIRDGWQVEITDRWLRLGNPWEIVRPEVSYEVHVGGRTEAYHDAAGRYQVRWIPARTIRGIAYDTPILGYRVHTCNMLRLWKSAAAESFDFAAFSRGDYYGAVEEKIVSENISKVLYPNDESPQGRQLRLEQQYFFVSCSLQDMIRLHLDWGKHFEQFPGNFVVQLNDTHPAIAIAELMRLLVDEHQISWDAAWEVTRKTFAYTNHTLLPEAMEKWPISLFAHLLPRHLEIIYEINARFLEEIRRRYPGDEARVARISLIDETGERYVRMAHLACVGCYAVNGVAALHSELLKRYALRDFGDLWPDKFSNKTNGVTPRRFLALSNRRLAHLITDRIGDRWIRHLEELRRLEAVAEDPDFQEQWRQVKRHNKCHLADILKRRTGVVVDPESLFDIQIKRIHEYKRQHLNLLHIITLYLRLKRDPAADLPPRTFILGGKAAPGYAMAKLMIKLIHSVAEVVNHDPVVRDRLKVVFFPDFNVKNGQHIYPAADLSEQISTAGNEASGTGNMKFALNGALTIGTPDGANIEIRDEVGAENFFLFGLTAEQVREWKSSGYVPRQQYESNPQLREVLDAIRSGVFSGGDPDLFRPLVDALLYYDTYMLLADYSSYVACQEQVSLVWRNPSQWTSKSIRNVARMGKFSSDRAIQEYCRDIWNVKPVPDQITRPTPSESDDSDFYVIGGTLRANSPSYVERQADRDLLEGLLRGEFCYILTSRQIGKSSLMVRTAQVLREKGIQVVVLDLTALGQNLTPEQWYDGLAIRLGRQLQLEDEIEDYWQTHLRLGACQRWFAAIRDVVLERLNSPQDAGSAASGGGGQLVVFVDELDVVRSLPFSTDEFFSAIRECYHRRIEDPGLSRLTFCLLGAAAPYELMQDPRIAPFNIGRRIELTDFSAEEAVPLVGGLRSRTARCGSLNAHKLLARILHWTHGHPYLTQRVFRAVAESAEIADANKEAQLVDRLCHDLFLSARAREADDNLLFVRDRLLRTSTDLASLLDLYERVSEGHPVPDNELDPFLNQLRLSGIVRVADQHLVVRNRIYQQVFDLSWIAANKPIAEIEKPDKDRVRIRATCSLGRTDANDLVLPDTKVSRHHAVVQKQGKNELWLADLGSRNGTFLNGNRVTRPSLLRDQDRIDIGPFRLIFHQPNAPRAEASEQTTLDKLDKTKFQQRTIYDI